MELGEIEARLSEHELIREAVVTAKERGDRDRIKYLCAYIVPLGEMNPSPNQLREYMAKALPAYMIPSFFIPLDRLPLTPAGKIDRHALPEPAVEDFVDDSQYLAPSNLLETQLVEIWETILDRNGIGVKDNFFAIGGDSIKAIQVISKIHAAGYKVEIKDLFRNPTIRQLGPSVKPVQHIPQQSTVTGTIPLTPVQRMFFSNDAIDLHHFNQAVMLYCKEGFDEEILAAVFARIIAHHDALRMTYHEKKGKVLQINRGLDHPVSLEVEDLRNRPNATEELEAGANRIQSGIDLENGPLMKLGLFRMDDGDRLLIVIHHLVIDGVSWRILFEDMETLYRQYRSGRPFQLPVKSDSFKYWSERLGEYANSEAFLEEKSYWTRLQSRQVKEIPKDFESTGNVVGDVAYTLSFQLNREETELLLTGVHEAFGTEINDILLSGLCLGIKKTWGVDCVAIDLEGHGREGIIQDIDISRTIGWFTSIYPVVLEVCREGDPALPVKTIKECLRQVPHKGIGYGILKYLTAAKHKEDLNFRLEPRISFNYLGQFDSDVAQKTFTVSLENVGVMQSSRRSREHELDVSGMIVDQRLRMSIVYNREQYKTGTIKILLKHYREALVEIISFCVSRERRELTPSDLTYNKLPMEELDRLQGQHAVEDIYTLTPMQEAWRRRC